MQKLAHNLGGPISGTMYGTIRQVLAPDVSNPARQKLLEELEALDGSVRSQRSLVYYFNEHRDQFLSEAHVTAPLPIEHKSYHREKTTIPPLFYLNMPM